MNALFQFITMTIPKAGLQAGGLPLTLNMLLFGLVLIINIRSIPSVLGKIPLFALPFMITFSSIILGTILSKGEGKLPTFEAAASIVVATSALSMVAIYNQKISTSMKIVNVSSLIVSGFMLVQYFVGIMKTNIPGLTSTYGQDLSKKNIGFGMAEGGAESNKMPSTYQEGNSSGLFLALAFSALLIWKPEEKKWVILRNIGLVLCVVGMILSGSRSIIIPMLFFSFFIIRTYLKTVTSQMKNRILLGVICAVIGILGLLVIFKDSQFVTVLADRYITQTMENPTSNRSGQWTDVLEMVKILTPQQLIRTMAFGSGRWDEISEGLIGFAYSRGLIAFFGVVLSLSIPVIYIFRNPRIRPIAFGLMSVIFAFFIDSTFYMLPSMMNYFMIVMIAVKMMDLEKKKEQEVKVGTGENIETKV